MSTTYEPGVEARAGTKTWAAHKERTALSAARDAVVAALRGAS